jgi:hypothetical protein
VITLYAKGQDVQVVDGQPVPPPVSSGSGVVTLYAKGQQVEVIDLVDELVPVLHERQLNMSRLLEFDKFNSQGRYTRWVSNIDHTDLMNGLYFRTNSHSGSNQPFGAVRYDLYLMEFDSDARHFVTSCVPAVGSTKARFPKMTMAQLDALPKIVGLLDIVPSTTTGETAHPLTINLLRGATQTFVPQQTGSYSLVNQGGPFARWCKLPMEIDPPTFTLEPRVAVPFSHAAPASALYRRDLSPTTDGDVPYVHTLSNGFRTALNTQGYAFSTIGAKLPGLVLRDGPFGVGTLAGATHLRARRLGGLEFTDPWSFGHLDADGTIKRLAGWHHTENGLELAGEWASIPAARHGFHELWGGGWWPWSVSLANLDTSQAIDGEHPHKEPPVHLLPDSQNNRVCALEFSPTDRTKPPRVIELLTGLGDPWDLVFVDDHTFALSERKRNRISLFRLERIGGVLTATELAPLVQGPVGYAVVDDSHRVQRTATIDAIRAQTCICPEGLFYQDGFVYFGSNAMSQIKRVRVSDRSIETKATWPVYSKAEYAKIAVSDGTFYPRGTMFLSQWDVADEGAPWVFLPNGTRARLIVPGSDVGTKGAGGKWAGIGYATACAVANGRLVYTGADYGVVELTLAQPGDFVLDQALYKAGAKEYNDAGYRLTHGIDGYSQWRWPLPFGKSVALDYYLTAQGHVE